MPYNCIFFYSNIRLSSMSPLSVIDVEFQLLPSSWLPHRLAQYVLSYTLRVLTISNIVCVVLTCRTHIGFNRHDGRISRRRVAEAHGSINARSHTFRNERPHLLLLTTGLSLLPTAHESSILRRGNSSSLLSSGFPDDISLCSVCDHRITFETLCRYGPCIRALGPQRCRKPCQWVCKLAGMEI